MLAHIDSLAVLGVDAYVVRVEVDVSPGLITFSVVGLPDAAVRESGERVRAAIRNSGFSMPARRITVNLAPADTKKQGPIFDLPIALGVLLGDGQLKPLPTSFAACGELGLNGEVRPIAGVLPMALGARAAGKTAFIVPRANAAEAAVVEGLEVYPVESLADAVDWLQNGGRLPHETHFSADALEGTPTDLDWADVKGQEAVKRALEVAAAGGHNILLVGAPGSGKTLLSRRLPTILPPLLLDEALEVTKLYSVAGLLPSGQSLISQRPFRSPHHTVSHAGLVGGGSFPRPGEISLSHHGILFLDELPEFHRDVLEVMRQPLEDGQVSIARAAQTLTFPARFQLVAAMNPCPCGRLLANSQGISDVGPCTCTAPQIRRYLAKVSGPLLDSIDIHIEMSAAGVPKSRRKAENSCAVRKRVVAARERQKARPAKLLNARLRGKKLRDASPLNEGAQKALDAAGEQFSLSRSRLDAVLRVARTIADLQGSDTIETHHVEEAINYRPFDRKIFA